eukprot:1160001-Pelagomonas_calceolata.AAC.9
MATQAKNAFEMVPGVVQMLRNKKGKGGMTAPCTALLVQMMSTLLSTRAWAPGVNIPETAKPGAMLHDWSRTKRPKCIMEVHA